MTKNRLYRTLKNVVRPITNDHSLHSPTTTHAMVIIRSTDTLFNDFCAVPFIKHDMLGLHVCLCKAAVSR